MRIYNYPYWIFLFLTVSIFFCFCRNDNPQKTDLENQNLLKRIDSIHIFQTVLDSFFIEGVQNQEVLMIVNHLAKPEYNLKVQGIPVKYIAKPEGYPKAENFDYSQLIISFEKLKVFGSNCSVTIYCKRAGIIGDFVLVQVNGKWIIQSYNKIYT